jgi:hypothetical protein
VEGRGKICCSHCSPSSSAASSPLPPPSPLPTPQLAARAPRSARRADPSFILLVPLNLFGLAPATTSALTLLFPAYKALLILERGGPTDNLLAYFVVLGYFQVLESLLLPILVSQIRKPLLLPPTLSFQRALVPRSTGGRSPQRATIPSSSRSCSTSRTRVST